MPVVDGGLVYVITSDYYEQQLYAFDALTGEEVWSYAPASHTSGNGNPFVINGKVVYYTGRQIVAVDADSGTFAWETSFFDPGRLASWYWDLASSEENGLIYATLYGSGAPFYFCAINADTGTVAWSHDLGGRAATMATPIVAEGKVYVSSWSQDGEDLWIFDAATGIPEGSYPLPSVPGDYTFMTMANGVLYATTGLYWHPVIYALDTTDGSLLWSAPVEDASAWPAVPANGQLYVSSETYGLLVYGVEEAPGFWVDLEVSTDTLTTTSDGWPTPNPVVITVTVGNNTDEVVENTAILFTLNSADWLASFYVLEENEHGDGMYQLGENQYFESYPEDYTLTLAPGMGIRTIWRVWMQPSEATTLAVSARLVQQPSELLAEDDAEVSVPLAQIHPMIFIPGILGTMPPTEDFRAMLDPNMDTYGPLLETLTKMGYVREGLTAWDPTLFVLKYDWRRSNRLSADWLDEKITEVLAETANLPHVVHDGKVDVVVHSMGGLITRAYIQGLGIDDESPEGVPITYDGDINKVIFIATPHKGFPITYRTREGLTWSDYMYNDNEWHLRLLMDLVLWPNLIEKKYGISDVLSDPACRPRTSVIRIDDIELRIPHLFCPWPKLYELSHHPSRGITSLLEMLPMELEGQWGDVPDYLCAEVELGQGCVPGTSYPYQDEHGNCYEANVFLQALNMYIDDLAVNLGDGDRGAGLEKIYVLYGTDKGTDHWYEVGESYWPPFWKYGMPNSLNPRESKYETPYGDDLIPTYSTRLKLPDMLPDLPEGNERDIADPDATHKGIMYNDQTQRTWVPKFLTGIEGGIPFGTTHTVPPFINKKLLVVTGLCPVDLMVTDSMGRRVGYDPTTGQEVNEIPDAFYLGAGLEMQYIIVPDGPEGQYEVTATGYEDGEYALTAHRIDDSGVRHLAVFTGTVTTGQVYTHAVYYQPDLAVEAGQDQRVNEGSLVSFSGSFSGPGDPDSYAVAWDLGDGTIVGEVLTPTHRYGDDGYYLAALAVASSEGWGLADSLTVAVANVPPTIEAGPDQVVNVAEEVILEGSFDDPGWLDTHTIEWEFGDGITQAGALTVSHVYTTSGVYTATLTVSDDDGGVGSDVVVVTVSAAPTPTPTPTVDAGPDQTADEGDEVSFSGTITDGLNTYTVAWDFGDGATASGTLTPTHTYADNDVYTVTLTVTVNGGAVGSDSLLVTVDNVAPAVGLITAPMDPLAVNNTTTASATFTDPGLLDTHTALWDWGDGNTSPGIVEETGGSGTVTGTHTYTMTGVYIVRLTVTDDDGDSEESAFRYIVIYDPEGGFVTGGGWIQSPEGAYTLDPSLTGKANFGFVSKYKKGANVPTGNTQFQFKVADLNFHSDTYQWLVVSGARARYKGVGTINGQGEYKFLLTAVDADINDNDSIEADRFRIKIWVEDDQGNETVVYDNGLGAEDYPDDPTVGTTEIGGGSIVIHQD